VYLTFVQFNAPAVYFQPSSSRNIGRQEQQKAEAFPYKQWAKNYCKIFNKCSENGIKSDIKINVRCVLLDVEGIFKRLEVKI